MSKMNKKSVSLGFRGVCLAIVLGTSLVDLPGCEKKPVEPAVPKVAGAGSPTMPAPLPTASQRIFRRDGSASSRA
jgi:hypothetical protein